MIALAALILYVCCCVAGFWLGGWLVGSIGVAELVQVAFAISFAGAVTRLVAAIAKARNVP
jgi:hypothetical protein